jgi:hypothetical protein
MIWWYQSLSISPIILRKYLSAIKRDFDWVCTKTRTQ